MDLTPRLSFDGSALDLPLSLERRHRYALLAPLCRGRRVLELYCASGQGSAILAETAQGVCAVDGDGAAIDAAQATVGRERSNVEFVLGDPLQRLDAEHAAAHDVVLCLEPPPGEDELGRLVERLRAPEQRPSRFALALPSSARRLLEDIGGGEIVPQFAAAGSLLGDRPAAEQATHFLLLHGFEEAEVQTARSSVPAVLSAEPEMLADRLLGELRALRTENARLTRNHLGKRGSAAAAALERLGRLEAERGQVEERLRAAEARVGELEAELLRLSTGSIGEVGGGEGEASEGEASEGEAQERALTLAADPTEAVPALPIPLDPGDHPNSWEQRHRRAAQVLIPWIEQTVPLEGMTVLEYGCGNAPVSCALAERAGQVIGVDIDAGAVELGRRMVRERGLANVELELHPLDGILRAVAQRRGEIDVFLFYAVLEHLTIDERLAVLALAREVVKPEGRIVVCEAPNRLIYFDHHTAQMPFFHLLEEDLALRYRAHAPRPDFRETLDEAVHHGKAVALETLRRLGRGVSFHEFELVFGDLSRHVIASNYDPLLFGERPVHAEDVILSRYLTRWRPDLAPVWSRYWLDLILAPQPVERRPPMLRPWLAHTTDSRGVGWTDWENLRLAGPESILWVTLPHPSSRLVVGTVTQDGRWLLLQARAAGSDQLLVSHHRAAAQLTAYSTFALLAPATRIALQASEECHIAFVGYDG